MTDYLQFHQTHTPSVFFGSKIKTICCLRFGMWLAALTQKWNKSARLIGRYKYTYLRWRNNKSATIKTLIIALVFYDFLNFVPSFPFQTRNKLFVSTRYPVKRSVCIASSLCLVRIIKRGCRLSRKQNDFYQMIRRLRLWMACYSCKAFIAYTSVETVLIWRCKTILWISKMYSVSN